MGPVAAANVAGHAAELVFEQPLVAGACVCFQAVPSQVITVSQEMAGSLPYSQLRVGLSHAEPADGCAVGHPVVLPESAPLSLSCPASRVWPASPPDAVDPPHAVNAIRLHVAASLLMPRP
jgi:hypothetical protein